MKYRDENGIFQDLYLKPSGDTLPIGTVIEYAGETIPYGWLRCDGSLLNASTYPELFNAIGTLYNQQGDESGYFRLPDRKGRVGVGLDTNDTDFDTIGKTGGSKLADLSNAYAKLKFWGGQGGGIAIQGTQLRTGDTFTSNYGKGLGASDTSGTTNNMTALGGELNVTQPYQVSNFIIKAKQAVGVVGTVANEYNENDNTVYNSNYINNINKYSTTEVFTGKYWIDNKPIYRKVLSGTLPIGSGQNIIQVPNVYITDLSGKVKSNYSMWWNINTYFNSEPNYNIATHLNSSRNEITLECGSHYTTSSVYEIIVEYTKVD